ncbi:MAG: DUF1211 domain-containing protein [Ignavibacteriaceae bacterium]|nr:DUF1211 domain-containing protein [Ignavibacteriaceae bacterium]
MNKPILEKNRIEAFSDGVIAIIITLLVLEIKVPHIDGEVNAYTIGAALIKILPKFLSWALSFFMVLIMWVNHHRIFNDLKHSDNGLMWVNGLLLFWMAFVPFPTAFMGDYFDQPIAMFFFGLCMAFTGLSFYFLRRYIYKQNHLLKESVDLNVYKSLLSKTITFGPVLYFIGAVSAFIYPYLAYGIYALIPIYFVFFGMNKKSKDN